MKPAIILVDYMVLMYVLMVSKIECNSNMEIFAYIGKPFSLRCYMNETTKFTRISHILPNGTVYTLLSNELINQELQNSTEIKIQRHKTHYEILMNPVRKNSAGTYTCEEDVSLMDKKGHVSNVTIHVINYPDDSKGDIDVLFPFLLRLDLFRNSNIEYNSANNTVLIDDDDDDAEAKAKD